MRALIDNGKYKVIEVLYSDSDRDVCLCSDVTEGGAQSVIVNRLKSRGLIRELLPALYEAKRRGLSDFCALTADGGCVCAVFRCHGGIRLADYFGKDEKREFGERVALAERLLSASLAFDPIDGRIAAGAFSDRNAVVDGSGEKVRFHFALFPCDDTEEGFRGRRLGGLLRIIFPPGRYLPEELERFIGGLLADGARECAAVYPSWREARESAAKTYEKYREESLVRYFARRIKKGSGGRRT